MKYFKTLAIAALGAAFAAGASGDVYLKLGKVEGDVATKGFEKWIELEAISDGVAAEVSTSQGRMQVGEKQFQSLEFSKGLDKASIGLRKALLNGQRFDEAEIKIVSVDGRDIIPIVTISLKNVAVSAIATDYSTEGSSESGTLDFGSIEWVYVEKNVQDGKNVDHKTGYDKLTGKTIN